jgi:DNA-binding NarL/FixJ family response regulator
MRLAATETDAPGSMPTGWGVITCATLVASGSRPSAMALSRSRSVRMPARRPASSTAAAPAAPSRIRAATVQISSPGSAQEERILTLVAEGSTNREIGDQLKLAEKTVKNYLSSIMSKLEVARRAEAAAYLARHTQNEG